MRIALDATPAASQRAGVGRYARELITALVTLPTSDEFILSSAAAADDNRALLSALPPGRLREMRQLPMSARLTTIAWQRMRLPVPIESFIGRFDLYHGTDFVVPPSRFPRIVTIHDLSFRMVPQFSEPRLAKYLNVAVPRALAAASIVITVSAAVAAEVADAFPAVLEKLVAVPNGVRMPEELQRCNDSSRPEILTVGTVEPRKNLQTLIDSMAFVRAEYSDARLTIAGRIGWQSDEIMASIRAAEAAGVVRFVEAPDDQSLKSLYASATIAVTPSHYEGFGLPVLEAMARRVPVVASSIPALRETGGDAAEYVNPASSESIANGIIGLLNNGEHRQHAAAAGFKRAERAGWQKTALGTRRAYSLALGRQR